MPLKRDDEQAIGWIVGELREVGRIALPVSGLPILIGSSEEANVRVTDEGAANFCAQVVAAAGGAQLIDLTGKLPHCTILSDGQRLTFGSAALTYRLSPRAAGQAAGPPAASAQDDKASRERPTSPSEVVYEFAESDNRGLAKMLMEEANYAERAPASPGAGTEVRISHRAGACTLTAVSGPCQGKAFPVAQESFTIGRSEQCTISLDDKRVSRRHARIQRVEGDVVIEDLGSANGVFVNGKRIRRNPLKPGDRIRIGGSEFLVHL